MRKYLFLAALITMANISDAQDQLLFGASKSGTLYGFIDLQGNWVIPRKVYEGRHLCRWCGAR